MLHTQEQQILHDRVNLVRLVRRLDRTVHDSDWGSERGTDPWLKSERLLQQRVVPAPPHTEPILPTLPLPPPNSARTAPPSHVASGPPLEEAEPPATDVDLLLGLAEEEAASLPREPVPPDADRAPTTTNDLPDRIPRARSVAPPAAAPAPEAASDRALLRHGTALQEELSAQLAQMAGQLRRNAEHFSNALVADQAVLRAAEEKVGANFDVMKRERVRLRDHRGRSLGTTCLTISSVLVVTIAFIVMLFIRRFT
ncbi:hypothetical protein F5148DRAFT_1276649 [Russula earlei]|uniref:Uncharacterized protein n=1 Tax=Russula earlei TaxID=71964 RepID=A0ACC0U4D9_9AGAM|nr:hypothetical protein F5148DRAFT_1276649 [Russula earlei]